MWGTGCAGQSQWQGDQIGSCFSISDNGRVERNQGRCWIRAESEYVNCGIEGKGEALRCCVCSSLDHQVADNREHGKVHAQRGLFWF